MKEFVKRWSNWWVLNPKRKQLDEAFEKELNELVQREVSLRMHDVVGQSEQLNEANTLLHTVHVICWDGIEYTREATKDEIDIQRKNGYVKGDGYSGITFDFRSSHSVSVCYSRDCFYYDKTDNTCVGNYKACTVKQSDR